MTMLRKLASKVALTLILLPVLWLQLVTLYVVLPTVGPGDPNKAALDSLLAGKIVERVYPVHAFFNDATMRNVFAGRSHFVVAYALSPLAYDAVNVTSDGTGVVHFSRMELAAGVLPDPEHLALADIKVGDADGVALPWFGEADGVLLFHSSRVYDDSHSPEFATPVPVVVEHEFLPEDTGVEVTLYPVHASTRRAVHASDLITLRYSSMGALETVEFPSVAQAPSWTLPVRLWLLHTLAPITILVNNVLTPFAALITLALKVLFWAALVGLVMYVAKSRKAQVAAAALPGTQTVTEKDEVLEVLTFKDVPLTFATK